MAGEVPVPLKLGLSTALVFGILALLSLDAVPPLYVGIRYNHFSKAADTTTVYDPGRYFILPFNKFLLFPTQVRTIEFTNEMRLKSNGLRYESLHTRTKEGLGLHLQVSLQYRLEQDKVGQLYNEFNMNYEQVYTSTVRDVLIKAASEYEGWKFWSERDKFSQTMLHMLNKSLTKTYAQCWGLQLLVIDLPDTYEKSIVSTQVQKQLMLQREKEQQSTQIRAHTDVIKAQYSRTAKVILAQAQANASLTRLSASALAQQRTIEVESGILGSIGKALQLSPDLLVLYQKYSSLDSLGDSNLFFGFGTGSNLLVQASAAQGAM